MRRIPPVVPLTSRLRANWTISLLTIARSQAPGVRERRKGIFGLRGTSVKTIRITLLGVVLATVCAPSLFSQRNFSTTYDSSRQVKLQGIVTRIDWVNPNAFFFIDTKDASGTVTNWAIQFGNPLELERSGWKRSALRIGDALTVEGTPARGTTRQVFAKSAVLTRTGKRLFTVSAAPRAAAPAAPAPRWPDGQIRLGPPPGKKGYWGTASTKVLVENSAGKVAMTEDGLLLNITDVDKVAPFQPWAKALYEYRQRHLLKDDPLARCLPPGGPPHTEALHLVERFTRTDLNTLKYEVTIDDPRTYTRTWTGGWTIQWVPDQEIQEYFCEDTAESTFVR